VAETASQGSAGILPAGSEASSLASDSRFHTSGILLVKPDQLAKVAGQRSYVMQRSFWIALFICALLPYSQSRAQTGKTYPTVSKRTEALTNSPIKQISADLFQIGLATINKKERTVSFPAIVNMSSNLIEFVCDGGDTKLHESLFRTEASPLHIHLAALLLSKPATNSAGSTNGQPIAISVLWDDGKQKANLEELISKRDPKKGGDATMPNGNWTYTGWNQYGGKMPAEISGVVIALLGDSTALINSRDQDHENEEIWYVNDKKTPRVGTPVEIILKFPLNSNDKKPSN
jgi:hypothetical protein